MICQPVSSNKMHRKSSQWHLPRRKSMCTACGHGTRCCVVSLRSRRSVAASIWHWKLKKQEQILLSNGGPLLPPFSAPETELLVTRIEHMPLHRLCQVIAFQLPRISIIVQCFESLGTHITLPGHSGFRLDCGVPGAWAASGAAIPRDFLALTVRFEQLVEKGRCGCKRNAGPSFSPHPSSSRTTTRYICFTQPSI